MNNKDQAKNLNLNLMREVVGQIEDAGKSYKIASESLQTHVSKLIELITEYSPIYTDLPLNYRVMRSMVNETEFLPVLVHISDLDYDGSVYKAVGRTPKYRDQFIKDIVENDFLDEWFDFIGTKTSSCNELHTNLVRSLSSFLERNGSE